jgi:hypothetical protein
MVKGGTNRGGRKIITAKTLAVYFFACFTCNKLSAQEMTDVYMSTQRKFHPLPLLPSLREPKLSVSCCASVSADGAGGLAGNVGIGLRPHVLVRNGDSLLSVHNRIILHLHKAATPE